MAIVQDVVCDGCGERCGGSTPIDVVTVVGFEKRGEPAVNEVTSRHYGEQACTCAAQIRDFLDDLAARHGVVAAPSGDKAE